LELITGNVVSEVDALMHAIISTGEKHVPSGKLVATTERVTLWTRCRTNWGQYNRVQL